MPRRRRIILSGFPHHVTHRGNRKGSIFLEREDRLFYLTKLREYSSHYQVRIFSYCLMTNHIHLIALPESQSGLSRCMHAVHGTYSCYFNRKYQLVGHLWQERFYACILEGTHLWNAVRYVEQNPLRAQIVQEAADYPWSSAAAHCGLRRDPILDPNFPPEGLIADWRVWLLTGLTDEVLQQIRTSTWKGVPCGSRAFLKELERLLDVPLLPRKRGRKTQL